MYDGPGSIAKFSDQRRNFSLLVKGSERYLSELKTGWRTVHRGDLEPNEEFEPCYASAICVRGGVSDVLPEVKEFMKEVFVEFP